MATIPKKVLDRYSKTIPKYQKILKNALDRDINEADTVVICQDILSDIFGFDKYTEITTEYAIRGTYCDLAIKMEEKIQYLIEVKSIGTSLKEQHLKQAIDYGVNKGVQWVVLTNGIIWDLYKVRFERPIDKDLVMKINMLEINPRKKEDQQKLFLLSKRGLSKSIRDDYYEHIKSVNRNVIGALILSKPIVSKIRTDLRKLTAGLKIELDEIEKIITHEVIKRDVIEDEETNKAIKRVVKLGKKNPKKPKTKKSKPGFSENNPIINNPS